MTADHTPSAARKRRLMEWRTIPVLPLYLLGALLWALGVCILSITDRLIGRDIGSQLWD